uniref:Glutathione peroxidase n=1 Tax=Pygocentrus nattereri TaxID=42514 RepID=A0AAR2LBZ9_PYGNA
MHATYAEKGLRILGFPCNQFGKQEPGSEEEIKEFAQGYNAEFDLFSKIDVNGDGAHPLWKWMKEQPKGKGTLGNNIKWNFTKFLIDKEGHVVKRYGPMDDPSVSRAICTQNEDLYSGVKKCLPPSSFPVFLHVCHT